MQLQSSLVSSAEDIQFKARLLAVSQHESGAWLNAVPISSLGLKLDNETVRVAIGLRLGANICEPHQCCCGASVDARGAHGLACKKSSGRHPRHEQLNDVVWRALQRAKIPSAKEPTGLSRADGKRPDGVTLLP